MLFLTLLESETDVKIILVGFFKVISSNVYLTTSNFGIHFLHNLLQVRKIVGSCILPDIDKCLHISG